MASCPVGNQSMPIQQQKTRRYSDEDLAYMQSLSAAVAQRTPHHIQRVIVIIAASVVLLTLWMAWAELDTVVRATGKVVPSSQVQKIQSLEGGVVSEILVHEGDRVTLNQPLMKISDIPFLSSYEEQQIKYLELKAKLVRLIAEAEGEPFGDDSEVRENRPELLSAERSLYESDLAGLEQNQNILKEQRVQAESQLLEAQAREKQLARSVSLLKKELQLKKPLVESRVLSEVEYLQVQVKEAEAEGELDSVRLSIPRIQSVIDEANRKIEHGKLEFQNRAQKELTEVKAEVSRILEAQTSLADRVERTTLRSPVNGTVKRIYVNTVGGVIKSGSDIVEIVPSEDSLLIEAKINPADIGNVEVGQTARIKFSAYDFAIYGSLQGEVRFISADTITDDEGNSFYLARISPEQAYLGGESSKLLIKAGMTTMVDIVTGKKTILHYLLKPVNRAMDSALRER